MKEEDLVKAWEMTIVPCGNVMQHLRIERSPGFGKHKKLHTKGYTC